MEMNIEKVNLTLIARSVMSELQKSQPQRHVEISIADSLEIHRKAGKSRYRIRIMEDGQKKNNIFHPR